MFPNNTPYKHTHKLLSPVAKLGFTVAVTLCLFIPHTGSAKTKKNDKKNTTSRQTHTSLRLAINNLSQTFPEKYTNGQKFLTKLDELEKNNP